MNCLQTEWIRSQPNPFGFFELNSEKIELIRLKLNGAFLNFDNRVARRRLLQFGGLFCRNKSHQFGPINFAIGNEIQSHIERHFVDFGGVGAAKRFVLAFGFGVNGRDDFSEEIFVAGEEFPKSLARIFEISLVGVVCIGFERRIVSAIHTAVDGDDFSGKAFASQRQTRGLGISLHRRDLVGVAPIGAALDANDIKFVVALELQIQTFAL